MLPWKDSSLWGWPQTLPFANQRFSGNLIERLHSSLPPILWYFFLLRNSNFKHFWPSTKLTKSKGHFEYTHPFSSPLKKKQHVPTPNFRPSTDRLHINNFTHVIHLKRLNGTFSAVGSTGISSIDPTQGTIPPAHRGRKFWAHSGRKWDKVGKSAVALSGFFHRVF